MAREISKHTRRVTQAQGDKAEAKFVKAMEALGKDVKKSSKHEDMREHIDFWVTDCDDMFRSFDVKAYKKCAEFGNVLIEFKNVNGHKGWLYGNADFIAFDYNDHFLCVARHELVELAERLCNLDDQVDHFSKALYKSYGRHQWGRKDQISLIKLEDIKTTLATFEIKY